MLCNTYGTDAEPPAFKNSFGQTVERGISRGTMRYGKRWGEGMVGWRARERREERGRYGRRRGGGLGMCGLASGLGEEAACGLVVAARKGSEGIGQEDQLDNHF